MARLAWLGPRVRTLDTSIARPPPKVGEPFYSSPEWIQLRDRVRREAGGRCQRPSCGRRGVIVDHVVELKDGGARLERANVMLLCAPCHTAKTARTRAERARRPTPGG